MANQTNLLSLLEQSPPILQNLKIHKQKHKSTFYSLVSAIWCCLGAFYYGYQQSIMNIPYQEIQNQYLQNSGTQLQISIIIFPIGAVLGCFFTSFMLNQYYSRRRMMMIADIIGLLAVIFIPLCYPAVYFIYRLLGGFAVGINAVMVPLYIYEISPFTVYDLTACMFQVFVNIGILFSYFLGYLVEYINDQDSSKADPNEPQLQHKTELIVVLMMPPAISCIVRFLIFQFSLKEETPVYFKMINESRLAQEQIKKLYIEEKYCQEAEKHAEFKARQNKSNPTIYFVSAKKSFIMCLGLNIFQQFTGINVFVVFGSQIYTEIFQGCEDPPTESYDNSAYSRLIFDFTMLSGVILMISAMVTGLLLKQNEAKYILKRGVQIMICSMSCIVICLIVASSLSGCATTSDIVLVILMFIFIMAYEIGFGIGIGPITWLYTPIVCSQGQVTWAVCSNFTAQILIYGLSNIFSIIEQTRYILTAYACFFFIILCVDIYAYNIIKGDSIMLTKEESFIKKIEDYIDQDRKQIYKIQDNLNNNQETIQNLETENHEYQYYNIEDRDEQSSVKQD